MGMSLKRRSVQPGGPKQCTKCKVWFPFLSQYFPTHRHAKRGLRSHCWRCQTAYDQGLRKASKDRWMDKLQALQAYGGCCVCCSESEPVFLTFDHMAGGGAQHRREDPLAQRSMGTWLIKNSYPAGFRILCFNCHRAIQAGPKHLGGICPHAHTISEGGGTHV